jgi:hypothetical protein
MRIDSSGNVGIGTSGPGAKFDVVGSGQFNVDNNGTSTPLKLINNATTGTVIAKLAFQNGGVVKASINAAVYNNDFMTFNTGSDAERMRIDSGGNLLIGTTSRIASTDAPLQAYANGGSTCVFQQANASSDNLSVWNSANSGNNVFVGFYTDSPITTRGSITYNRAGGLVAYNVSSDYRAKDIIGSVLNSGEVIDSVPVYMGKMKGATQARPMFIAHETPDYAHTGEKDAVDKDGKPIYQQMDVSSLVPVLWAEIQSLRKRIAALESK